MDRLHQAILEDGVDYLAPVKDAWGDICGFPELANRWADLLLPDLRAGLGWSRGAVICLSSLLKAERYEELSAFLSRPRSWDLGKFGVAAMIHQGRIDEALAYAHACARETPWGCNTAVFCQRILLEAGRLDEAFARYGLPASHRENYLAAYRAIRKRYPERDPRQVLSDLIAQTGAKGKWFAAAREAGAWDLALECAAAVTAEPATLARAARDLAREKPDLAARLALYALEHFLQGRGYRAKTDDVVMAHAALLDAAAALDKVDWARDAVDELIRRSTSPLLGHLRTVLLRHSATESRRALPVC
jgi:hypothetical protein